MSPNPQRRAVWFLAVAVLLVGALVAAWSYGVFGRSTASGPEPTRSRDLPSAGGPPASSGGTSSDGGKAGVTVAAVGDMVCDPKGGDEDGDGKGPRQCQSRAVSDLVVAERPAAFITLGDNQYSNGTLKAFRTSYDPSFGRMFDITYPVPGNHEYQTPNAAGYFGYFGSRAGAADRGYYSYDLAGWHVVALNSNCDEVSCAAGEAQERWLRADLAAHPAACTLAYWHHPRWSHGDHGNNSEVAPLVKALYDAKAEVVLNGHDHNYERFTPRAPDGSADPEGLREFVVGTGGRDLRSAEGGNGTDAMESDSFGALFLTLKPTGYSWQFKASNGTGYTDTGSGTCH